MKIGTLCSGGIALLALLLGGCHDAQRGRHAPPEQARRLLLDRNWLDRMPETDRDRLHVYRFVPQMGGGVYQDRTLYAGSFELFTFQHSGTQIRFNLPHRREQRDAEYRITELEAGEAPSPFDLRLDLDRSPRGPATYYGVRSEHQETASGLDAALQSLLR